MENFYALILCLNKENSPLCQELLKLLKSSKVQVKDFTSVTEFENFLKRYHKLTLVVFVAGDPAQSAPASSFLHNFNYTLPLLTVADHQNEELTPVEFLPTNLSAKDIASKILVRVEEHREFIDDEFEMTKGFLEETYPMLEEIEEIILSLEEPVDHTESLNNYFRLLHTIKGTSACIGYTKLGAIAHEYESYISDIMSQKVPICSASISVLLDGFDHLKAVVEEVKNSHNDEEAGVPERIAKFKAKASEPIVANTQKNDEIVKEILGEDPKAASANTKDKDKESDRLSVTMTQLDQFSEMSGELTVIRGAISKTVSSLEGKYRGDSEFELLKEMLSSMYKVSSQIQQQIVEIRKVPVSNVLRPYKRLVRDLSKNLGKRINFETKGDDLSIDNIVARVWSNALVHILRNSIDHGIETPEERVANGKSESANITLSAYEQDDCYFIEVSDDGRGLSREKIGARAIQNEIFDAKALQGMNDKQVHELIFHPGFSTAEKVTDVSGRGVGLDMVKTSVQEIGGQIDIHSRLGRGVTFKIKIPVPRSVMIMNALMIECQAQIFLISMDEVVEVIRVDMATDNHQISTLNEVKALRHHDQIYPILSLSHIFSKDDSPVELSGELSFMLLRALGREFAVLVDEILGFEEIVVRSLEYGSNESGLFLGASLVGSGQPALILSSEGLANDCQLALNNSVHQDEVVIPSAEELSFLSFHCFSEETFALPLDQIIRVEKVEASRFDLSASGPLLYYREQVSKVFLPEFNFSYDQFKKEVSLRKERTEVFDLVIFSRKGRAHALVVSEILDIVTTHQTEYELTNLADHLWGTFYSEDHTIQVINLDFIVGNKPSIKSSLVCESSDGEEGLVFNYPDVLKAA